MPFIYQGDRIYIGSLPLSQSILKPAVYLLQIDEFGVFYLTEKESFVMPKKIYGNHSIVDRWIKSYNNNREKNMGVVLTGLKGTGKTITAQMLCMKSNLPVILINAAYSGVSFINYITNPELGKCIVFIDEFEKIYNEEKTQKDLLSIMDGNFRTNLLFLLTVNEFRLNQYLNNRLNRIKYRKVYSNLENDIVHDVIDDMLVHRHHKESIINLFDKLGMCTFDLLVNIIKEVNLFNEDANECAKHLNLDAEEIYYKVTEASKDGQLYELYPQSFNLFTDLEIRVGRPNTKHVYTYINKVRDSIFCSAVEDINIVSNESLLATTTAIAGVSKLGFDEPDISGSEEEETPNMPKEYYNFEYKFEDRGSNVYFDMSKCKMEKMSNTEFKIYPDPDSNVTFEYMIFKKTERFQRSFLV